MQVKVGDLFQNRYVLKFIAMSLYNEPTFFLYDREKQIIVDFNKEKMLELLNKGGDKQ